MANLLNNLHLKKSSLNGFLIYLGVSSILCAVDTLSVRQKIYGFFFFKHPQFLWFYFPLQTVAAEQDVSLSLHVASEVAFPVLFQGHNCR